MIDQLCRIGKVDLSSYELFHNPHVDRLLRIHIGVVIRFQDVINDLKYQRKIAEILEVSPVESGCIVLFDNTLDNGGNSSDLVNACLVDNTNAEDDTTLLHPFVVLDPTIGQIAIGKHQLLAAYAPDASRLETHVLHCPEEVPYNDEVADNKRLVNKDGKRAEGIP